MKKLVKILGKRCEAGQTSMLVTIVNGSGSTPRGTGAIMAVGGEGRLAGTIGGGMLEFRATETAMEYLKQERGGFTSYRLTKDEVAKLGMVCGGDVDVLYTYIPADEETKATLNCFESYLDNYIPGFMILPFRGGIGFLGEDGAFTGLLRAPAIPSDFKNAGVFEENEEKYYVHELKNTSRVYVFGGGHLAQELVPLLTHLGFRCIVTDDREEYSTRELFPAAEEVHTLSYRELDGKFDVRPQDYIVAVTRGHVGDFDVQCFALKTPAYYIGVVGSRNKIAEVNRKLKNEGFTDEDIKRITAPIGISIKSETPAEIAVSIAAQLIERRASYKEQ